MIILVSFCLLSAILLPAVRSAAVPARQASVVSVEGSAGKLSTAEAADEVAGMYPNVA